MDTVVTEEIDEAREERVLSETIESGLEGEDVVPVDGRRDAE